MLDIENNRRQYEDEDEFGEGYGDEDGDYDEEDF